MENQFQQMTAETLAAACDLGDEFEAACAAMIRKLHAENQQLQHSLSAMHETLEMTSRSGASYAKRAEKAEDMLEAIGAGGVGVLIRPTVNWADVIEEIRALPTRSTGYPPYQHSPDWVKQQAADVVRKHLGEQE